jgi:hypothetical protein
MTVLSYGSFSSADAECTVSIRRKAEFDARGQRWLVRHTWQVSGFLQATGTALAEAIAALEAAYSVDGNDLTLGPHSLISSQCLGGTRVIEPPYYPEGRGAELSTYRSYGITVEGMVLTGDGELKEWTETLSLSGDGSPRVIFLPVLNGPPVKQVVQQQTTYRGVQSGRAIGLSTWPTPPPPLFPDAIHGDQTRIDRTDPEWLAGDKVNYAISWNYVFESADPLGTNPSPVPEG